MPGDALPQLCDAIRGSWPQLCWSLAFGVALACHCASARRGVVRLALGLWLGACFAHLGWLLLHLPRSLEHPEWWLGVQGASLLFVPLGVLLVAPWRESLAALPLALAVARLGCLPFACCYPNALAALPELAGYVTLHLAARRWPGESATIALSGLAAIRLLSLPLRAAPAFEPLLDPAWIAGAWLLAGLALRRRIGSAARAREWIPPRFDRLLRTLALLLGVWLLFPLAGALIGDAAGALLVASLAALAWLVATRTSRARRIDAGRLCVLAAALAAGYASASLFAPTSPGRREPLARIAVVVLTPAVEELLYRERLLDSLRELWGAPAALLASSALFALGHVEPRVMPVAFAGGLACGAVVLRTGSLAAVIALHAGWNLGASS